jgi:hypothetical protein
VGVALATDVMRRMPSGGEAEAAIRMDVKEQSLKGIMGLVKRGAVEPRFLKQLKARSVDAERLIHAVSRWVGDEVGACAAGSLSSCRRVPPALRW